MERVILHYDMDCFYASIETRDNPKKYKNKPMVVAGGVVTTANYEARKYGIHSAMRTYEAKNLCPHLLVVSPNKDKYMKVSEKIHELVLKITHRIEFIALDEGYIDISDVIPKYSSKEKFAKIFRERIYKHTELSGGQRQRVAIARALINNPAIILADEPTGNLDSVSEDEIMKLFQELNEQGKTIVVVSHEPEIVKYCKRIVTFKDGKIISDGETQ